MNVTNSFCIPVFNRYTIPYDDGFLHPLDNLTEGILSQTEKESFEVVIIDFGSTDTDYAWVRHKYSRSIIVTLHEPFNLGRGRNLAGHIATGKRLFILDCDMNIPPNFVESMKTAIDAGKVYFPLYELLHPNGKVSKLGSGWGNCAMLKSVFLSLYAQGVKWEEKTEWGGEDTAFSSPIVKKRLVPYERRHIDGFQHVWHPRINTEWHK